MLFIELASTHHKVPRISDGKILYDTLLYERLPLSQKLMCCITALGECGDVTCETKYASIKAQVEQLWSAYVDDHHSISLERSTHSGFFPDGFTSLTVAFFTSAHNLLAVRGLGAIDVESLEQHWQLLLHAATYLNTDHNAITFMHMAMPLLLVSFCIVSNRCSVEVLRTGLRSGLV